MSLKIVHTLYPCCIFRAQIVFKNVAPSGHIWAEGVLCRDFHGDISIINRKTEDGSYAMCPIDLGTLGLSSGFKDGNESDIFEGDIIRICRFSWKIQPESAENENISRRVSADIPEGCEKLSSFDGVVFMNNGVFYVQFFDESTGTLNALPLYVFFGYDRLPAEETAVKVIGNMYDNEKLFAKTLRLSEEEQDS